MELIPVLSIIILVATICTFILAAGAYILYKIHGKKTEEFSNVDRDVKKVELIEPEDFGGRKLPIRKSDKVLDRTKLKKPIGDSILKQQKLDKSYQESERKKIKRKPVEPKYLKFDSENQTNSDAGKTGSVISWR